VELDLAELARTDFRTTKKADAINSRFQNLLGMPYRYGPARLAIGMSLAREEVPSLTPESPEVFGKPIKGETLFGTGADLATWLALIVQHSTQEALTKKDLQAAVALHWARGIELMWGMWEGAGEDFDQFLAQVVKRAKART
jgi:DNA sulfur modification protein DndE